MRKKDLKVGQSYAYYTGRQPFHMYSKGSHRMGMVLRNTEQVELLDAAHEYQKRVSTWSEETYTAKGISVKKKNNGETITLASGTRIVMPWADFDKQTADERKAMAQREKEEEEKRGRAEKIVDRALKVNVPVIWDGDGDDPEFELSYNTLEKVVERLEKKKKRGEKK